MVVDLVLKFDDERQRVADFTINSLGNFILVLFTSGQTQFLDVDILKRNYDDQMPEYLIEGETSEVVKMPCDDIARMTGIVNGNTFKKVSKFQTEYFHKAREALKNSALKESNNENINPGNSKIISDLTKKMTMDSSKETNGLPIEKLFTWEPVAKLNGVHGSLCEESKPPKFGLVKLKNFLRKYGAFPDDMRLAIWGYLLNIPLKKNAFEQMKFLGEYNPEKTQALDSKSSSYNESLKSEILKWKSKWNLKQG